MSHRRRLARGIRSVVGAAALTLVSIPAWAHVEVEADRAFAGATDVTLTFQVPNERAPATTQSIMIFFPTDHPLIGVTAGSQNGFTPTMSTIPLAEALQGPKGLIGEFVWAAQFSGGQLSGEDEKAFTFHVDQLPTGTGALTFKVLQKYSTGETVSWIEVAADGAAEPENPAPVLALGKARATPHPTHSASQAPAATAPAATAPPVAAAPEATHGTSASTTAHAAVTGTPATGSGKQTPLVASALGGLVLAGGGWALWRRRRVSDDIQLPR